MLYNHSSPETPKVTMTSCPLWTCVNVWQSSNCNKIRELQSAKLSFGWLVPQSMLFIFIIGQIIPKGTNSTKTIRWSNSVTWISVVGTEQTASSYQYFCWHTCPSEWQHWSPHHPSTKSFWWMTLGILTQKSMGTDSLLDTASSGC